MYICEECQAVIGAGEQVVMLDGLGVHIICYDCKEAYEADTSGGDRYSAWEAATEMGLVVVAYQDWDGMIEGREWAEWDSDDA